MRTTNCALVGHAMRTMARSASGGGARVAPRSATRSRRRRRSSGTAQATARAMSVAQAAPTVQQPPFLVVPDGMDGARAALDVGVPAVVKPVSLTAFGSQSMQDWVHERLSSGTISHIFVFSGQMAQYVPADFDGRFIMDFVDVDSAKFESYAGEGNALMRWVHEREGRKLAAFEAEIARRADASLFVSMAEAGLFRARSGADRVAAMGNGIDTVFYDPSAKYRKLHPVFPDPLIVFTGQMDYRPNIEAVSDFAHNALPAIRAAHPETTFAIVGRNPAPAVVELSALPGVQVTGAVDDVRTWLSGADIVVAPLRIARGIQNKVLEAMAMAKPVVASTAAAEGIDAVDGEHLQVKRLRWFRRCYPIPTPACAWVRRRVRM
jgi:sugar transferase (PEP-CTERM/EpsH1 system associated)